MRDGLPGRGAGLRRLRGHYADLQAQDWFVGWVAAAYRSGLIGPDAPYPAWSGDTFGGNEPATRAEAAALLANLLEARR